MKLLALRLDDHDSNMCLLDGAKVSYVKTERLYQDKHHAYNNNWEWAEDLEKFFGVTPNDIDEIAIVADPLRYNINHSQSFVVKPFFGLKGASCPVWHIEHHYAHALSAWMFGETKWQFVFDGVGEVYRNNNVVTGVTWSVYKNYKLVHQNKGQFYQSNESGMTVTSSYGVEYENLARHCGLEAGHPNDLAGKLMSLQSFGKYDDTYQNELHPDGWVEHKGKTLAELTKLDMARTFHVQLGKDIQKIISDYVDPFDSILFTGGCAQNICWNTDLKTIFPKLVVTPHSADDGLSLGCIKWLADKHKVKLERTNFPYWQQDTAPEEPTQQTIEATAKLLAEGKIVGWYQGHGEVGPRALGNRSILMNPMLDDAKHIINTKVKHREEFRPFGATVLEEYQDEYFSLDFSNPHMLYYGKVKKQIPSITHIDGTCRFQTLGKENTVYRQLIETFNNITGVPLLLNTSLNRGGKPIAGSKRDALGILYETDLDVLVYGNEIIKKDN